MWNVVFCFLCISMHCFGPRFGLGFCLCYLQLGRLEKRGCPVFCVCLFHNALSSGHAGNVNHGGCNLVTADGSTIFWSPHSWLSGFLPGLSHHSPSHLQVRYINSLSSPSEKLRPDLHANLSGHPLPFLTAMTAVSPQDMLGGQLVQSREMWVPIPQRAILELYSLHWEHQNGPRKGWCSAFFSGCLSPTENSYDIGNRELLAMELAVEEGHHLLPWVPPFSRIKLSQTPDQEEESDIILPAFSTWEPPTWVLRRCPDDKLYIPDNLRSKVLDWCNSSRLSCHAGITRTTCVVQQCFCWPSLKGEVNEFVSACLL